MKLNTNNPTTFDTVIAATGGRPVILMNPPDELEDGPGCGPFYRNCGLAVELILARDTVAGKTLEYIIIRTTRMTMYSRELRELALRMEDES